MPTPGFFQTIEEKSCVIIDDQYDDAITDPTIRQAFKVDRRHSEFSLILITQSLFDNGRLSKGIRNNAEIWILFKNFGLAFYFFQKIKNVYIYTNIKLCHL